MQKAERPKMKLNLSSEHEKTRASTQSK